MLESASTNLVEAKLAAAVFPDIDGRVVVLWCCAARASLALALLFQPDSEGFFVSQSWEQQCQKHHEFAAGQRLSLLCRCLV